MAIAMPDLSWAEQQRAGFCRMVRLGCGSNLRNSDALMQKHSNWKARRAKDNPTIAPAAGCKGHSGSFQEMVGLTFLKRPLISSHARQIPCFAAGRCTYYRHPNS
jgi:hypothetical protein